MSYALSPIHWSTTDEARVDRPHHDENRTPKGPQSFIGRGAHRTRNAPGPFLHRDPSLRQKIDPLPRPEPRLDQLLGLGQLVGGFGVFGETVAVAKTADQAV